MVLTVIELQTILMFYVALTAMTVTKYLSIYHGHLMELLDEIWVVKRVKMVVFLVPAFLVFLEYGFISRFEDLANF